MYTDSIQVIKHSWNIYVLLSNRVTLQRELVKHGLNMCVLLSNRVTLKRELVIDGRNIYVLLVYDATISGPNKFGHSCLHVCAQYRTSNLCAGLLISEISPRRSQGDFRIFTEVKIPTKGQYRALGEAQPSVVHDIGPRSTLPGGKYRHASISTSRQQVMVITTYIPHCKKSQL